jgi:hypothetical protein
LVDGRRINPLLQIPEMRQSDLGFMTDDGPSGVEAAETGESNAHESHRREAREMGQSAWLSTSYRTLQSLDTHVNGRLMLFKIRG